MRYDLDEAVSYAMLSRERYTAAIHQKSSI